MIGATVNSWSCFCWLYTASLSLATKTIINLYFSVDQLVKSRYRVFPCFVQKGCLQWTVQTVSQTLLDLFYFILYSKAKFASYSRCFLTSYFCSPAPYSENYVFLVLEALVGLPRTIQHQLLQNFSLGYRLVLLWMACFGNRDHSVFFHLASEYCISDSFVDSISSKRFLPTVVDILVIWVKFTHSSPF